MQISSLVRKGKKVIVEFYSDDSASIRYETAVNFGLRKNDELSDSDFEKILEYDELNLIKENAFRYLNLRPHSMFELRTKLRQKNYPKEIINKVIQDLSGQGYLNDESFAIKFLEEKLFRKKEGLNIIKSKLIKKGINRNIIDSVIIKYSGSEINYENAFKSAKKKLDFLSVKNLDKQKLKQKIYTHLVSRGYDVEYFHKIFDELGLN